MSYLPFLDSFFDCTICVQICGRKKIFTALSPLCGYVGYLSECCTLTTWKTVGRFPNLGPRNKALLAFVPSHHIASRSFSFFPPKGWFLFLVLKTMTSTWVSNTMLMILPLLVLLMCCTTGSRDVKYSSLNPRLSYFLLLLLKAAPLNRVCCNSKMWTITNHFCWQNALPVWISIYTLKKSIIVLLLWLLVTL